MNNNSKNIYFALLHNIWLTHKKLFEIYDDYEDPKIIYNWITKEFLKKYKFLEKQIEKILINLETIKKRDIEKYLEKYGAYVLMHNDPDYPEVLNHISNPPFLMYVQWKIDNSPKFSIVGSRKITSYGQKCIDYIVPAIWKYFEIVSWWALGCDTKAHKTALENGLKTIVVVWTWLAECYPTGNKDLYKKIAEHNWAIISIFPFTEPGSRYNFPIRNEIVAGLSVWTLVVEAQKKSWTLITANLCHDLWKDVFACPGEIFKQNSTGCNMLISSWNAKIVCCPNDILQEYNVSHSENASLGNTSGKKFQSSNILEKKIYECLLSEWMTIDELFNKTDTDIQNLTLKLSLLEIWGYIQKWQAWKYELK